MIEQKIVELAFDNYPPYANDSISKNVNAFTKEGWTIKQIAAPGNTFERLFVLLERDINSNDNYL